MAENPDKSPFKEIVRCNIGNPQALGQPPPAFARAVLSQVVLPKSKGSKQVRERADAYRAALRGGVGAYSDSQGVSLVREEVATFISDRDGYDASPDDIFLTDGASAGVRHLTQLLVSGPQDGVLAPAPQYPLYSATTTLFDGTLGSYYLDEAADWAAPVQELKKAYDDVVEKGATPKLLVIINPGNPTGASLPRASLEAIVRFVEKRPGLVLAADEVYQENVYGDAPPFISFKKIVRELNSKIPLVSFHSISKGFTGECGLRGGYFELTNIDAAVKAQLTNWLRCRSARTRWRPRSTRSRASPASARRAPCTSSRPSRCRMRRSRRPSGRRWRRTRSTRSDCSKARAWSRCPAAGSARRTARGTSVRPFYRRRSRSTTSCRSSRASTSRSWPSTAAAASSKEGVRLCNAIVPQL